MSQSRSHHAPSELERYLYSTQPPLFLCSIVRAGDAIYVRVGDHDLTQKYGSPGAQTLRVATTYIHHNHNSQTLDNDIAILKLHGEADLKEGVCLVCLPARGTSQSAGKKCTVTGYGYMGESKTLFSNVQSQLKTTFLLNTLFYIPL